MIGLFIGAGFSKWCMNLPLVNELFDFEISNIRRRDEIWFKTLQKAKDQWDIQNPNSNNEKFIQDILNGKKVRLKKYLSKYLARRLSEPFLCQTYGGVQTFMYNDKSLNDLTGITKAKEFIKGFGIKNVYGIITTNYDLIIEYSLGTPLFNFGKKNAEVKGRGHNPAFPWQNTPVVLKGDIIVAKIHGSIAYDGFEYWSSGICGLNGRALIIPPSPEKKKNKDFNKEWRNAKKILNKINELIIFGFNFNPYDTAVLDLLKTNVDGLKRVHIYDIESKINKASKIWDEKKIIEYNVRNL